MLKPRLRYLRVKTVIHLQGGTDTLICGVIDYLRWYPHDCKYRPYSAD